MENVNTESVQITHVVAAKSARGKISNMGFVTPNKLTASTHNVAYDCTGSLWVQCANSTLPNVVVTTQDKKITQTQDATWVVSFDHSGLVVLWVCKEGEGYTAYAIKRITGGCVTEQVKREVRKNQRSCVVGYTRSLGKVPELKIA